MFSIYKKRCYFARLKTISRRHVTNVLAFTLHASSFKAIVARTFIPVNRTRKVTETTKLFKKNEKLLIQKLSKQYNIRTLRIQQPNKFNLRSVIPYDIDGTESEGALV